MNDMDRHRFPNYSITSPEPAGGPAQNGNAAVISNNGSNQSQNTPDPSLNVVILIPSDETPWNRYLDVYRTLIRELGILGHKVRVLTKGNRRAGARRETNGCRPTTAYYADSADLKATYGGLIKSADAVVVGSGLAEGRAICDWVTRSTHGVPVFYDLTTSATITGIKEGTCPYLSAKLVSRFQLYLSVTGGRILETLETEYDSPMARPLYHSVDPTLFYPERTASQWDLGYFGDFEEQREPALDELLIEPARLWSKGRFAVAGPNRAKKRFWPANVRYMPRLAGEGRRKFYNAQKFALTAGSAEAAESGFSPGRRLLEAAACGVPVISDYWEGLETFFEPLEQILIARCAEESLSYMRELGRPERQRIGARARHRVLAAHTSRLRALELQGHVLELIRPSAPIPG